MNNLIFGIITVIACATGYIFAFKLTKKNNFKFAVSLVILCGFILRIYTGSDLFLHEWDEKYHGLVAKHLIDHPLKPTLYENAILPYNVENWVANHIWLEKPPVPLWLAAVSLKIFGISEIVLRFPALFASTLAILLTFLIAKTLFNKRIGFFAAFLHSINGLLIEVAGGRVSSDLVETWFIFFVEAAMFLSVYAIENKKNYSFSFLIGLLTGLSLLSKWSPGLLVFPVWFIGACFSKHFRFYQIVTNGVVMFVTCALTFLPWMLYVLNRFPAEGEFVFKKFLNAYGAPLEQHTGPIYYYLTEIRIVFGELIYLPILLTIVSVFTRNKVNWKVLLITSWWAIPLLIFSFAATKRQTYLLISAPAYFIMISYWIYHLLFLRKKIRYTIISNLLLCLLILLPVRYCIERIKPFEITEREPDITVLQRNIKNHINLSAKTILFNVSDPISLMFYNDCIAYAQLPPSRTIDSLIDKGYNIIVNDNGQINRNNFKANSSLTFKKIY